MPNTEGETWSKSDVGTTPTQITDVFSASQASGLTALEGVEVTADIDNDEDIFVGVRSDITRNTNDATDGYRLLPGTSILIKQRKPEKIYVTSAVAGQRVNILMM
jgi:hypothetical protein